VGGPDWGPPRRPNMAMEISAGANPAELSVNAPEFSPGKAWNNDEEGQTEGGIESWLRVGYWSTDLGWWVPYYLGKLKSYNSRTGYGFLESEQTHAIYNTDVYIHKSQVPSPWTIGQQVEFAVQQNSRGQPQASDVLWLPAQKQSKQEPKAGKKTEEEPPPRSNQTHIGQLKSYSHVQGYGFIECEEIMKNHSCDVYLDRGQVSRTGECRSGTVVEFEVAFNARGQPQARHINWDPVPHLPRTEEGNATGTSFGLTIRSVDPPNVRNLTRLLGYLRAGNRPQFIKTALEFQDKSESVDFIAFAVDRLVLEEVIVSEEVEMVEARLLLLVSMSKVLKEHRYVSPRKEQLISWVEALMPSLSVSGVQECPGLTLTSVTNEVLSNIHAASTASDEDAAAFQGVLGKFPPDAQARLLGQFVAV